MQRHLCDCEPQLDAAIEAFKRLWPHVPTGVATDVHSTYLHIAVNWLEVSALADILGPDKAIDIFAGRPYYRTFLFKRMSFNEVVLPAQHRWS